MWMKSGFNSVCSYFKIEQAQLEVDLALRMRDCRSEIPQLLWTSTFVRQPSILWVFRLRKVNDSDFHSYEPFGDPHQARQMKRWAGHPETP